MTLIVSTRVPDGIVIAADSLSSISAMGPKLLAKGKTKCPHCGEAHDFESPIELPMGPGVTTTLPYSQKLQPLWNKFGVGTHGSGAIGKKTVFGVIRDFENQNEKEDLRSTANALAGYLQNRLEQIMGEQFSKILEGKYALGFQIVGYEEEEPLTISADIGKKNLIKEWPGFGSAVSGVIFVATKLWELKGMGPQLQQPYPAWSIQDALDYCEFLIESTAKYQRFASAIPSVGGEIDIGLVLPGNKFKWLRKKKLASILLEEE